MKNNFGVFKIKLTGVLKCVGAFQYSGQICHIAKFFEKKFYLFFILDKSISPVYFSRLISLIICEFSPVPTDTSLVVRTF